MSESVRSPRSVSKPVNEAEQRDPGDDSTRVNFRRGYVACISCRTRKVRCVLDSEPPCAKCKREHRECLFETHRKSLRHREPPRWTRSRDSAASENGRQLTGEAQALASPGSSARTLANAPAVDFAIPSVASQENGAAIIDQRIDESPASNNPSLAEKVLSTVMAKPVDALNVLFDAAQPQMAHLQSSSELQNPGFLQDEAALASPEFQPVPPQCLGSTITQLSIPSNDTLDLWDKSRFVRQGLITAQEAVTYLDLFFILPGAGGVSRSHHVHQRLWQYCELLIRRVMFGQEKLSTAKTRVVGTIESFILISDWHPRAIHFPPETEGWDVLLIQPEYDGANRLVREGDAPLIRWREDVFEPAKRAERMSWMLLGAATNLAYELGILADDVEYVGTGNFSTPRQRRAKQLLFVYVSQQAVRMGFSSILPQNITLPSTTPMSDDADVSYGSPWKPFMDLWMDLTQLTKTASAMFFQSKSNTRQQLLNGHYLILLQHFAPSLSTWYERFISSSDLSEPFKDLLFIEYQYLKIYTSALSIQAVVERALARGISTSDKSQADVFKACVLPQDWNFIREVVSGGSKILQKATSMAQVGRLRYTPMRTLFCITTASVLLLKAITIGVHNTDVPQALEILDECIAALRSSAIDDMDFSPRYATLMEKHVSRFRGSYTLPQSPSRFDESTQMAGITQSTGANDKGATDGQAAQQPTTDIEDQVGVGQDFDMFDPFHLSNGDNDWATRPFDPNVAPFGASGDHLSLGLELDSLDFLWNLPDPI